MPAMVSKHVAVRAEFMRSNPCPVNGATRGACPGFEADHVIALCSGGRDEVANLEWRRKEDHTIKTKFDTMRCQLNRGAERATPVR
jgi:hypothetical protein